VTALTLCPAPLRGVRELPPSKSEMHRALICAALSEGETALRCPAPAADVMATADCLRALGADIRYENGQFYVNHISPTQGTPVLDCGESGSTLRFLLPLAGALGRGGEFLLRGGLKTRPVAPLLRVLGENGCKIEETHGKIRLAGRLRPGAYEIDASLSSQFLTGFLLALPLLGDSVIRPSGQIVSKDYVNLTCAVASRFGVEFRCEGGVRSARCAYRSPGQYVPEGDWSAAAFWLCADAMGAQITLRGLREDSAQGDRAVLSLIAGISAGNAVIDCGDVPDLLPPLAVLAAVMPGETAFVNAARLRQKESDRLAAMCALLQGLGGDCTVTADGLRVRGVPSLRGGSADSFGDHRIAMAAAVAAAFCEMPVRLTGADCVSKSYPAFWADYRALGGIAK